MSPSTLVNHHHILPHHRHNVVMSHLNLRAQRFQIIGCFSWSVNECRQNQWWRRRHQPGGWTDGVPLFANYETTRGILRFSIISSPNVLHHWYTIGIAANTNCPVSYFTLNQPSIFELSCWHHWVSYSPRSRPKSRSELVLVLVYSLPPRVWLRINHDFVIPSNTIHL